MEITIIVKGATPEEAREVLRRIYGAEVPQPEKVEVVDKDEAEKRPRGRLINYKDVLW